MGMKKKQPLLVIPEFRVSEISGTHGRHTWPWVPALGLAPEAGMTIP
jgi:hypothetical protein